MKKHFKILSVLLCLLLVLPFLMLSGCSDEDFNLYFGVEQLPKCIDPQRALLYSEVLTVKNCFTGLMKFDDDGKPTLGVANKYTLSDDKLTYTFTLGDNEWSNGKKVTADDFVFAIERACSPETKTTGADLLYNIAGAKERLSGEDSDLKFYSDGNNTVVIELIQPDSNFLYKLTEPVFMPCNEDFFEDCKGKYGLGTDYILTNGKFKVHSWSTKSNYVRLMRVGMGDKSVADVKSVYISMGTSGKDTVTRINDGEIGMTLNHSDDYTTVNTSKYSIETAYNKNYIFVFNKNTDIGSNALLTDAFATSIDFEKFAKKLNDRFKVTRFILPENSSLNGSLIQNSDSFSKHGFVYSAENSRKLFLEALKSMPNNKFPSTEVLTVDDSDIKSALNEVVSGWQSNLGAYVNIKTVSNEDTLLEKITSGDFKIALIPVSSIATEVLHLFTQGSAADIKSDEFDKVVAELDSTFQSEQSSALLIKALEILSLESTVIPVFATPTAVIWDISYKNVVLNKTDMTVDFSTIYK